MFLRNVGIFLQVYTVLQPRRPTWTSMIFKTYMISLLLPRFTQPNAYTGHKIIFLTILVQMHIYYTILLYLTSARITKYRVK